MAKAEPSKRRARRPTAKVPLTYYRSGPKTEAKASPFERRQTQRVGRTRKVLLGLADVILLAAIVLCLIYAIVVQPQPHIIINNNSYHSRADYEAESIKLFEKLQNRNKVSLNQTAIIKDLQVKFPEIAGGDVELPLFSEKPTVRLSTSPPAFSLKSQGGVFVVDQQGVAVGEARDLPSIKNLPAVIDQSNFGLRSGKQVLSADAVRFVNVLLTQCQRAKIPLKSLTLPPHAEELDLTTKDQPYYVKFYLGGDPLIQSGQFLAARHQFATGGGQPAEYLDVRVPGKIFFK